MFYQFTDTLTECSVDELLPGRLTVGYVKGKQMPELCGQFGFGSSTAEACRSPGTSFRSAVELFDTYTFTELRVIGDVPEEDDCLALCVKNDLMLVVDVVDSDGSTEQKFRAALKRCSPGNVTLEKLICTFFDTLLQTDSRIIEQVGMQLSELEDELLDRDVDRAFNTTLLQIKKRLLRLHNYYEQILDITESLEENENGVLRSERLFYLSNISRRVERLREDADSLKNTVEHLQDAYFAYLDTRLNNIMKVFTVLTSIFFPLTIIVGWYGMNFTTMPELTWKYGYIYVIVLSVLTVLALVLVGKRKKWF